MNRSEKTRTVKKKFLQIDRIGKVIKGFNGYAVSLGTGFLIAKTSQNMANSKEANFIDEEKTEDHE